MLMMDLAMSDLARKLESVDERTKKLEQSSAPTVDDERIKILEETMHRITADVKKLIEKRMDAKRNDERIRMQGEKLHTLEAEVMHLVSKPEKKWSSYEQYDNIPKDLLQEKVSEVVF